MLGPAECGSEPRSRLPQRHQGNDSLVELEPMLVEPQTPLAVLMETLAELKPMLDEMKLELVEMIRETTAPAARWKNKTEGLLAGEL